MRKNSPKKTQKRLIFAIIIGILVLWGIDKAQYNNALKNGDDPANKQIQSVLIQKGASAKTVAQDLEEKHLIAHARFFTRYVSENNLEQGLIAGRFEISPSMTISEIAAIVTDGKKAKNTITIPEGFSIKQIDARIVQQSLAPAGTFMNAVKNFHGAEKYPWLKQNVNAGVPFSLEGFLFPDTYTIDPTNFSAEELIDVMLKNFEKKLPKDLDAQLAKKNITLLELVTVASMLEKEGKSLGDLPIIAGIIWKRANQGWFLNIDATLLYEKNGRDITKEDLQKDSPYNTYTHKGLTPGPIGNPGLRAISSALNPEKTPYFFYLTDPKTGKAVFATTNEQQNINRAKYLIGATAR